MSAKMVFSIRLSLIILIVSLPTYPTLADSKTTSEFNVIASTTIWGDLDAEGNTIYTQLDIYNGDNGSLGVGTQLSLSRTVISPEGDFVYTDDSFFGSYFTTEPVFQVDEKFKNASLAPVTFEDSNKSYTIQVNWTALGDLTSQSSNFKQAHHGPIDQYQVKFEGDTESREALATGSLNGQSFSEPSWYAILQRYTTLKIIKGEVSPFALAHPDYFAPTVELGKKLLRGGEGSVAEATWSIQNPDGTTSEMFLSIFDGVGSYYRPTHYFEGTDVYLRRIIKDENGHMVSLEDGGYFAHDKVFNISTNLDRANLAPVQITICPWWERDEDGNCINGEAMIIQAEWSGVEKLVKYDRFRFTEVTNCDDVDCWTTDYEHNFKIKVIGTGASRYATATGSLNGIDLGASGLDDYGQAAYLLTVSEYSIQYGGIYPFNVFPISVP